MAQAFRAHLALPCHSIDFPSDSATMAPMKKAKAVIAMSKSGIAAALAEKTEQKPAVGKKFMDILTEVATKEVKKNGKFTIPGLCMLKTKTKPATKAGKREIFGKVVMVKAKPAKTVVKAYCVSALKKSI